MLRPIDCNLRGQHFLQQFEEEVNLLQNANCQIELLDIHLGINHGLPRPVNLTVWSLSTEKRLQDNCSIKNDKIGKVRSYHYGLLLIIDSWLVEIALCILVCTQNTLVDVFCPPFVQVQPTPHFLLIETWRLELDDVLVMHLCVTAIVESLIVVQGLKPC